MKGLLIKDFSLLKPSFVILGIVVIGFTLMGNGFSSLSVMYAAVVSMSTFTADEQSKWNQLVKMMPYSTNSIVVSKYIIGYVGLLFFTIISTGVMAISDSVKGNNFSAMQVNATLISMCLGAVVIALICPIMFKFGMQKGMIAVMCVFAVFGMIIGFAAESNLKIVGKVVMFYSNNPRGAVAVLFAIAVVLNILSIMLSKRFYNTKKD